MTEANNPALVVPIIDRFRGEHFFLSNFYPAHTPHRGLVFPTSEHAYVAAKTSDDNAVQAILAAGDPAEAKRISQEAPRVVNWPTQRFTVMDEVITAKFTLNPELAERLLATAGAVLVEGNTWHDQAWGSCSCDEHHAQPGDNALGVLLMAVRLRLAAQRPLRRPGADSPSAVQP